jgi:peptidyl-prolyl cis-trans isomerase C
VTVKGDSVLRRLLREPLLHFILIGTVLFAGISLAKDLQRPTVRIDARDLEQLAVYWEQQTQRPPTKAELAAMIHERVDEELLAREAVRLGLDKDDMIVRRRLAQKMSFASEDVGATTEPDDATLRAYYARTAGDYATPARLALRHVFFSADRTGVRPELAASEALAQLRKGQAVEGDPSLLPLTYADVSVADLARDYGPAFLEAAQKAPEGVWVGPVASPFGVHLLRVEARHASQTPSFDTVRAEVRSAWIAERRKANNEAYLKGLRKKYRVVIAGVPE